MIEGEDSLRHLAWHAALSLAPAGVLETKGQVGVMMGQLREVQKLGHTLLLACILS